MVLSITCYALNFTPASRVCRGEFFELPGPDPKAFGSPAAHPIRPVGIYFTVCISGNVL